MLYFYYHCLNHFHMFIQGLEDYTSKYTWRALKCLLFPMLLDFEYKSFQKNIMKPLIFFINQKTNNIMEKSEKLRALLTKRKKAKERNKQRNQKLDKGQHPFCITNENKIMNYFNHGLLNKLKTRQMIRVIIRPIPDLLHILSNAILPWTSVDWLQICCSTKLTHQ